MTTSTPASSMPASAAGPGREAGLDGYLEAMDAAGAPLLGHLVLYSIFDGQVTRKDIKGWFAELGLDERLVPDPIRPVDAFERITGPAGVRVSYPLADPAATGRRRQRPKAGEEGQDRVATLMVRHVRRDGARITRHVVREVRDEAATALSYDTKLAECVFVRDTDSAEAGAGSLRLVPAAAAIAALPEGEQQQVRAMLDQLQEAYRRNRTYLTGDRLRAVIRAYIESLTAIRVRPTGGVYFVHAHHAATLAALRELVSRFGEKSHLSRIPIPDQDEMREMIITAFTTKARDDLDRLARDIAEARRDGAKDTVITALHKRFTELQAATAEHAGLLATSLDDTDAALQLVQLQLTSLLTQAS
jgi:hypothetical protein